MFFKILLNNIEMFKQVQQPRITYEESSEEILPASECSSFNLTDQSYQIQEEVQSIVTDTIHSEQEFDENISEYKFKPPKPDFSHAMLCENKSIYEINPESPSTLGPTPNKTNLSKMKEAYDEFMSSQKEFSPDITRSLGSVYISRREVSPPALEESKIKSTNKPQIQTKTPEECSRSFSGDKMEEINDSIKELEDFIENRIKKKDNHNLSEKKQNKFILSPTISASQLNIKKVTKEFRDEITQNDTRRSQTTRRLIRKIKNKSRCHHLDKIASANSLGHRESIQEDPPEDEVVVRNSPLPISQHSEHVEEKEDQKEENSEMDHEIHQTNNKCFEYSVHQVDFSQEEVQNIHEETGKFKSEDQPNFKKKQISPDNDPTPSVNINPLESESLSENFTRKMVKSRSNNDLQTLPNDLPPKRLDYKTPFNTH